VKVLVFPRNADNPYQNLLYGEMPRDEITVAYFPMPTWSQTVNVLLFPAVLAIYRLRGFRILHIHWTYLFAPVWVVVMPGGRRLMQFWFQFCIAVARVLGFSIVWTAHNVVPLDRVFADDNAARRLLVKSAAAVIVHTKSNVQAIESFGETTVKIIPFGRYGDHYPHEIERAEARRRLGLAASERVIAFIGSVKPYKGIDSLFAAVRHLKPDISLRLIIAGSCRSSFLRHRIEHQANELGPRVSIYLEHIPDEEIQIYFAAADAVVFPFQQITNSSSLLLALNFGVPVIIPCLSELGEIPDTVAIRYEPEVCSALAQALTAVSQMDDATLASMATHAKAYGTGLSWERSARETTALYRSVLACRRDRRAASTGTSSPR
jgi:glycosyltransferase involved in cell wall biosynthesis